MEFGLPYSGKELALVWSTLSNFLVGCTSLRPEATAPEETSIISMPALCSSGYLVHQSGHAGDVESAVTTSNIAAYLDSNSIEINLHFLSFRIRGLLP